MTATADAPGRALLAEHPASGPSIREIVFPSDLTATSDRAFEHAALLAERLGARLTLVHVVRGVMPAGGQDNPEAQALLRAEREADEHLHRLAARRSPGAACRVEHGESTIRALRRFLETQRSDLIVMATHGREWIPQLLLGSVAAATLNAAQGPLLLVREPDHGVALPYRRILIPTDMSEPSRRAFPMAGLLARSFGAEVIALHVAPAPHGDPAFGTSGVTYEVEFQVPSEAALAAFVGDAFEGVRVTPRVLMGSAWSAIMDTATMERADLIVLSTHGLDSMADRLIGSHAERIVRHAPCPVLIA
jgi:nucleotide-binding universal stress UspA family protein